MSAVRKILEGALLCAVLLTTACAAINVEETATDLLIDARHLYTGTIEVTELAKIRGTISDRQYVAVMNAGETMHASIIAVQSALEIYLSATTADNKLQLLTLYDELAALYEALQKIRESNGLGRGGDA